MTLSTDKRKAEDRDTETEAEPERTFRLPILAILSLGSILLGVVIFGQSRWMIAEIRKQPYDPFGTTVAVGMADVIGGCLGGGLAVIGLLLGFLSLLVTKKTPRALWVTLTNLGLFCIASLLASEAGFIVALKASAYLTMVGVPAPLLVAISGVIASSLVGFFHSTKTKIYPSVFSYRKRLLSAILIGAIVAGGVGFAVLYIPTSVRSDVTLRIEGTVKTTESVPDKAKVILQQYVAPVQEDRVIDRAETTTDSDGHYYLEHYVRGICDEYVFLLMIEPLSGNYRHSYSPIQVRCTRRVQTIDFSAASPRYSD